MCRTALSGGHRTAILRSRVACTTWYGASLTPVRQRPRTRRWKRELERDQAPRPCPFPLSAVRPDQPRKISNYCNVLPAEAYEPTRKGVAWQVPDVGRWLSVGPRYGVYRARRPPGGGRRRSSQPGIGTTILSPRGWCCTPKHFVLCGTYRYRRQEYSAVVHVPRDDRVEGRLLSSTPPGPRGSRATYYLPPGGKLGKEKLRCW
jgi:hypothetical protein